MKNEIKIMTFNIRSAICEDGINDFRYRAPKIRKLIAEKDPDIICFQEVVETSREWIIDNLSDYYMVGCGRNADHMGEQLVIAYKKRDLYLIACETRTLSFTPNEFGTRYEAIGQSEYPRIYVKAFFKHKNVANPFFVYNVHTDHLSDGGQVRILEVSQVLRDILSDNENFVLTGDFNACPDTAEMQMLIACRDRNIIWATKDKTSTYHEYGKFEPETGDHLIDYIFTDGRNRVIDKEIIEDIPENGVYLSDHYPLTAVLEMK